MEYFLNTFTLLFASFILLVIFWWRNKFNYWKTRNVQTTAFSYIWGSMQDAFFQKEAFSIGCQRIYNEAKSKGWKHVGIYFMWNPMYIPLDIELVKNIMQVDFHHFVDRGIYVNEKADPLSAHLFSLEGKKWKLLRTKLTPTFTSGKMKMMFETLVDCSRGLRKVMNDQIGKAVDIKDILGRYTTDVIGSCAFGLDCNSLENPNSEFRERGKAIFEKDMYQFLKEAASFLLPNLVRKFDMKITPDDIGEFFLKVIKDTVEYREREGITRKDFLQLLIQLKNKGKLIDDDKVAEENITNEENTITLNEISAQAFIFFEAGFETSSTTMTFSLYELAKNKEIQEKARQEIRTVLKKYDGKLTYDAAMELHYLEQVINETLRKYPPVPILNRNCTKQYKVPGTDLVIEKDMKIMIPVYGIHRDPEYYPDPEKFDPERFSEENKKNLKPFTFLPFGEGPRVCIGVRFGMLQTKVGLAALLINFDFDVSEKTKEPIDYNPKSFILLTKGDVWLNYKRIDDVDF